MYNIVNLANIQKLNIGFRQGNLASSRVSWLNALQLIQVENVFHFDFFKIRLKDLDLVNISQFVKCVTKITLLAGDWPIRFNCEIEQNIVMKRFLPTTD